MTIKQLVWWMRAEIILQGIWALTRPGMALLSLVTYNDTADVVSANETLKQLDLFSTVEGCTPNLAPKQFTGPTSFYDAYQGVIQPTVEAASKVGVNLQDLSRIVSYDIINDKTRLQAVKDYILGLPAAQPFLWQNSKGSRPAMQKEHGLTS